ncbi:hypothetical protein [Kribbella deserti]|uniref:ABC transporter permease n=1 Tax=Kribbella deserti TaxID=1926257 RepID=A0ABV6QEX8_9ACTN
MVNPVAAEFRKALTLPSVLITIGLSIVAIAGLGVMAANSASRQEPSYTAGFEVAAACVVGIVVLAVFIMSSEYTPNSKEAGAGRQIAVSLTSVPQRGSLFAAKAVVVAALTGALATIVVLATVLVAQVVLGDRATGYVEALGHLGWRIPGAIAYGVCTGLITFAITVVTRSGVIPLILVIVNSTVVSVSYLLTKVTPLAKYLPDVAGAQAFAYNYAAENMLDPLAGGLVMAGWTAVLLAVAGWTFHRRDA